MMKPSNPSLSSSSTLADAELELQPIASEIRSEPENKYGKQFPRQKAILVILACLIFLIALVSAFRVGMKRQEAPVMAPTLLETENTKAPVMPSLAPVLPPNGNSQNAPSESPTAPQDTVVPTRIAFDPGNLVQDPHGLMLSVGLQARIVAQSEKPVLYEDTGNKSQIPFHELPDFGGTFVDTRPNNTGGWIYVSNSEVRRPWYNGGVGALTFNAQGQIVDYRMLLTGTTSNCGGGITPWGSWVSGEEYREGLFWQVDPTGERPPEILTVGNETGMYESFAADSKRNQYFVTEDYETGPVRRFVPSSTDSRDPWSVLHGEGETTYLLLKPTSEQEGTYEWTSNKNRAQSNAQALFPNCEGIDVHGDKLYFISKLIETVFVLDLGGNTYSSYSTRQGLFQGQPDQMIQFKNHNETENNTMYFFTEDGSASAGVHARTEDGKVLTILEGPTYSNEVTGLAFSPDYTRMYFTFQVDGVVFEVVREDGLPFTARSLNLRYHSSALDSVQ